MKSNKKGNQATWLPFIRQIFETVYKPRYKNALLIGTTLNSLCDREDFPLTIIVPESAAKLAFLLFFPPKVLAASGAFL